MKMHRHYMISDDLDDLERLEEQLEAAGISTPQIHVLSNADAELAKHAHLHEVQSFMKSDLVHSTTRGAMIGVPAAPDWQGRSLFDDRHSHRAYFYVAEDHFRLAVREGRWKYIFGVRDGRDELYDLDMDPLEQHNVAAEHPDRCDRLRQRLAAWTEANRRQYERVDTATAERE